MVSRKYIPRECTTEYIPGIKEESKSLYETYKKQCVSSPFSSSTMEYGIKLLDKMPDKTTRWEEITTTNMTHNSPKVWKFIRKLSNGPATSIPPCLVSANQVAHQLLINGKNTMPSTQKRHVLSTVTEGTTSMVYPFSEGETLVPKISAYTRWNCRQQQLLANRDQLSRQSSVHFDGVSTSGQFETAELNRNMITKSQRHPDQTN